MQVPRHRNTQQHHGNRGPMRTLGARATGNNRPQVHIGHKGGLDPSRRRLSGLEGDFVSDPYSPGQSPLFDRLGLGPAQAMGEREAPAVSVLAGDVKVRSKLISWNTFSLTWILFLLFFIVGNGALAVITGLDMVGLGPGWPLLDIIWHFALFVVFGALLIYLVIQLGSETLLGDNARLPLITFNATLFNFVMTFVFLSWILNNTSQHAQVSYSDNMKSYSSFVAISAVSFLWFFVVVAVALVTWLIHYNRRKTLELVDLVLSVDDQHLISLHDTSLATLVGELKSLQKPETFVRTTTTTSTMSMQGS